MDNHRNSKFFGCSKCPNAIFATSKIAAEHSILYHQLGYQCLDNATEVTGTGQNMIIRSKNTFDYYTNIENISQDEETKLSRRKKNELINIARKKPHVLKIKIPQIDTLVEQSIVSLMWSCILCKDSIFDRESAATNHVAVQHNDLRPEDILSRTARKYNCLICNMKFKKTEAGTHYTRHLYLFTKQTELKGQVKTSLLLKVLYHCNICKANGKSKAMRMHVWEIHNMQLKNYKKQTSTTKETTEYASQSPIQSEFHGSHYRHAVNATETIKYAYKSPFQTETSEYHRSQKQYGVGATETIEYASKLPFQTATSEFHRSQNRHFDTSEYLITKDLLKQVGITESSETTGPKLWKMIREIPDTVYSCCLCPHQTLLKEQVNAHKKFHDVEENKIITPVSMLELTESRFIENGFDVAITSCICQHSKFNRTVLGTKALRDANKKMLDELKIPEDRHESAETKLIKMYDYQFFEHIKHRLSYRLPTNAASDVGNQKCITVIHKECITSITTVHIDNIVTGERFIVMKNLLKLVNIDEKSKTSGLQKCRIQKPSELVYSCFLCPHLPFFTHLDLNRHMATKHFLREGYEKIVSAVPTATLVQDVRSNIGGDVLAIRCLCQYTTFKADVMSEPFVSDKYKSIRELVRMYKNNFTCHNTYKVRITKRETKPDKYVYTKIPTTIKTLRLHEIRQIDSNDFTAPFISENVQTERSRYNAKNPSTIMEVSDEGTSKRSNSREITERNIHKYSGSSANTAKIANTNFTERNNQKSSDRSANTAKTIPGGTNFTERNNQKCSDRSANTAKTIPGGTNFTERNNQKSSGSSANTAKIGNANFTERNNQKSSGSSANTAKIGNTNFTERNNQKSSDRSANTAKPVPGSTNFTERNDQKSSGSSANAAKTVPGNTKFTERNNQKSSGSSANTTQTVSEDVIFVRDVFKKIKHLRYCDPSSIIERKLHKLPAIVYGCCLCPHIPMYSPIEVKTHITTKHHIEYNHSVLMCTIPIETLIDDSGDTNDDPYVYLDCICQHASFSKKLFYMPLIIYKMYEEMVKTLKIEKYENINTETKLIRIYEGQECPRKHKVEVRRSKAIKRPLTSDFQSTSPTKIPKLNEKTNTAGSQNTTKQNQPHSQSITENNEKPNQKNDTATAPTKTPLNDRTETANCQSTKKQDDVLDLNIINDITADKNDEGKNEMNDTVLTTDENVEFDLFGGLVVVDETKEDIAMDEDDDDAPLKLTF